MATGGKCPTCGVITSVGKGQPVPPHQRKDSRETCTGGGKNAK